LRKTNNKFGLAKVLRNFSTGKMKNHWNELDNIKCKTLLIAGEFDKKYCEINKKISGKIKSCQLEMIKKAGHNTHLENHFEYISVVNNFLTNYF
jgi:2-succinyl-6-hydroxy-2,4-cyclohexadiene-1-carboxylate synthase